jgi:hypothetical protein
MSLEAHVKRNKAYYRKNQATITNEAEFRIFWSSRMEKPASLSVEQII